ncbi:uncharacterized protein [Oscarella lobularis]
MRTASYFARTRINRGGKRTFSYANQFVLERGTAFSHYATYLEWCFFSDSAMLDWVSPLQWSFKGAVGVALIKTFSVSGLCSSGPQVASTSLLLTSWRRFWNTVRIQTVDEVQRDNLIRENTSRRPKR